MLINSTLPVFVCMYLSSYVWPGYLSVPSLLIYHIKAFPMFKYAIPSPSACSISFHSTNHCMYLYVSFMSVRQSSQIISSLCVSIRVTLCESPCHPVCLCVSFHPCVHEKFSLTAPSHSVRLRVSLNNIAYVCMYRSVSLMMNAGRGIHTRMRRLLQQGFVINI